MCTSPEKHVRDATLILTPGAVHVSSPARHTKYTLLPSTLSHRGSLKLSLNPIGLFPLLQALPLIQYVQSSVGDTAGRELIIQNRPEENRGAPVSSALLSGRFGGNSRLS